jgi:hypothetical protein
MKKFKEYKIDSFNKLANAANNDNYKILAVDLAQMFLLYYENIKKVRRSKSIDTDSLLNTEIFTFGFKFVDDGKNDILGCNLQNNQTGEITKIKYKKNK